MKKIIVIILMLIFNKIHAQNTKDRIKIVAQTNISELQQISKKYIKRNKKLSKKSSGLKKTIINSKGNIGYLSGVNNKGLPEYDFEDNLNAAVTSRVTKLWSGGESGYNLTGKGVEIGHWEAGGLAKSNHQELEGRVKHVESSPMTSHATHTAGTMIASGVNSEAKGMAPLATIVSRKSDNDETEMIDFAINGGIISNHSYSTGDPDGETELYGLYDSKAVEWDEIAYNAPYYLICKSAGNNRNDKVNVLDYGYDIIYTVSGAKNILTVGAVDDVLNYTGPSSVKQSEFSNWGPTDDWRIKPDITANGVGILSSNNENSTDYSVKSGSSMAVAVVTGSITLLQEHYHNLNNIYMKSATAKALVIAAADEVGVHDGPDFQSGWGLLNAERAALVISNNNVTTLIKEEVLRNGNTYSFDIEVDGASPLTLTIAWGDPAGYEMSGKDNQTAVLVNDLDVRITGNGNTYFPWVMTPNSRSNNFTDAASIGDNFRDNVEKIDIPNIEAGKYTISVTHKNILVNDVQYFSLVVNGIKDNVPKVDTDNDGIYDAIDNCPLVENPDQLDSDGDGEGDVCDTDDDNDGILDENDNCPLVLNTNQLDVDGDGEGDVCDTDDDNDGILDENDNCPLISNFNQLDFDNDGTGDICDADDDNDSVLDENDNCNTTPLNTKVDVNGCAVFSLPFNNFTIEVIGETCRSSNNGTITITTTENHNYTATVSINGELVTQTFLNSTSFQNLEAGTYSICITIQDEPDYESCFTAHVTEPEELAVLSKVNLNSRSVLLSLKGGNNYNIELNNELIKTTTNKLDLNLKSGINTLKVTTNFTCQGVYRELIVVPFDGIKLFPNPIKQGENFYISTGEINTSEIEVSIYSTLGVLISSNNYKNNAERRLEINVALFPKGLYMVKVSSSEITKSYTILIE